VSITNASLRLAQVPLPTTKKAFVDVLLYLPIAVNAGDFAIVPMPPA